MARKTTRSFIRLGLLAFFVIYLIIYLDNRFKVLPNSVHNHLPTHTAGHVITDITIKSCSKPNPLSICTLDPAVWTRLSKDVYLQSSWLTSAFIHYKTKHEKDLTNDDQLVLDVKISRTKPTNDPGTPQAKWEARPGGLWVKVAPARQENNFETVITDIDILYGPDSVDPRSNWQVISPALFFDGTLSPHVTVRRGNHQISHLSPVLRLRHDGKFKILQVSDLHLSTGTGHCRDEFPDSNEACEADPRTLEFVGKVLDSEKPDLVVLSGDQVNGETAPDAQTAIFKYAELLASRRIPYATIFGNHDDLDISSLPRGTAMNLISKLPYSISEIGPHQVSGVGNYLVEVLAPSSSHSALTIYLFDSHGNRPDGKGYDWIKDDQIDWFKQTSLALKEKHDKYTHIHLNMAFIHIPLPEYRGPANKNTNPHGEKLEPIHGDWREAVTAPTHNTGLRDALVEEGVSVVSAGHDHVNSYCGLSTKNVPVQIGNTGEVVGGKPKAGMSAQKIQHLTDLNKIWLCYAGGAGHGGYGGHGGYSRRVRVFELDGNNGSLKTWLRVENEIDHPVDELLLVMDGRPAVS